MPFPINQTIRVIQGTSFKEECAWRGNIVVARYRGDLPFSCMINATMAEFALVKNYFITHGIPRQVMNQMIPFTHTLADNDDLKA